MEDQISQVLQALVEHAGSGDVLARLLQISRGDDDLELALLRVGHCLAWGSEYYALAHIGQGGGWQAHLGQAVYFILRSSGDTAALQQAAQRAQEAVKLILSRYLETSADA